MPVKGIKKEEEEEPVLPPHSSPVSAAPSLIAPFDTVDQQSDAPTPECLSHIPFSVQLTEHTGDVAKLLLDLQDCFHLIPAALPVYQFSAQSASTKRRRSSSPLDTQRLTATGLAKTSKKKVNHLFCYEDEGKTSGEGEPIWVDESVEQKKGKQKTKNKAAPARKRKR
ncbi:hypothetical protein AGDE_13381 [Angomonas deanei]|uniref:Uncharacterized protein n=1 Tax=Angomonas deanei TaxID=59799 RepID=A0A7G2C489_9TRYP|nr:hypothetical protein AGDE_13381 [Angomonas deanei]CAD2214608.1 hypothetical protein, conserved [Angomonas deanei]|eukprot:EPY22431.1 hypothetical protein AGDE_13381 [Angomonas deanei]